MKSIFKHAVFSLPLTLVCAVLSLPVRAAETKAVEGAKERSEFGNYTHPMKRIAFKQTSGKPLYLYLFAPTEMKPSDRRPAIVFFHGGALMFGGPGQFFWHCDYLAGRGMVAIEAEYRLMPREDKRIAGSVTLEDCIADAKSAIRYVRAHAGELGVDPERIASGGGSSGGYLASAAAIVPGFDGKGEDTSVSCKPNLLVLYNPAMYRELPDEHPLSLKHFTKETPPALVLFGSQDPLLAQEGRRNLEESKIVGHHLELYAAEGAGHGFFNNPPWREAALRLADEFLAKYGYTKGEAVMEAPGGVQMKEIK